tara:strand:- start:16 stop:759 length:744 start_codon:yes stop_codon:yes gene_type:complete
MWILLKLYSKLEIIYKKLNKTDVKKITIKIIENGEIVKKYDNEYLNKHNDENKFAINTDIMIGNPINKYMIIGEYSDGENIKIVRFKNVNDIKLDGDYYTESGVKLLGIQLNIKNNGKIKQSLPILFYKNCNHFIENNILFDRKFINYYLKTEKMDVLDLDDNYEIVFFDNDINTHTITDPQYIKINKEDFETIENNDNYEILNNTNDSFEDCKDVNKSIHMTNRISQIINSINWVGPIYTGQDDDY